MGMPLSFINTINCNPSFFCKPKNNRVMEHLYRVSKEFKISILPISNSYALDNLYPITDRVREWNTFVIGNDKTYILSNINDTIIDEPNLDAIVDTKGFGLPDELFKFFDKVWTFTLKGQQLQFYIVVNGKLYFINTYCLRNENNKIIGAVMFMRKFDTLPESYSDYKTNMSNDTKTFLEATNNSLY